MVRTPWPQHGMLHGIAAILPCKILVGTNIPTSSTPSRECCEGIHVRHLIRPSSGPQPQTSTLSVLQILIKCCYLSSCRLPMTMYAIPHSSIPVTHIIPERQSHGGHRRLDWLAVLFICRSQRRKPGGLRSSGHEICFDVQSRRGRI